MQLDASERQKVVMQCIAADADGWEGDFRIKMVQSVLKPVDYPAFMDTINVSDVLNGWSTWLVYVRRMLKKHAVDSITSIVSSVIGVISTLPDMKSSVCMQQSMLNCISDYMFKACSARRKTLLNRYKSELIDFQSKCTALETQIEEKKERCIVLKTNITRLDAGMKVMERIEKRMQAYMDRMVERQSEMVEDAHQLELAIDDIALKLNQATQYMIAGNASLELYQTAWCYTIVAICYYSVLLDIGCRQFSIMLRK